MRRLAIAATALALAACSGEPEPVPATGEGALQVAAAAAPVAINLDAAGIRIPAQEGLGAQAVSFGAGRSEAEQSLSAALGPVEGRGENADCPGGPMQFTEYDGLTLIFRDEALVGWSANGSDYLPGGTPEALMAGAERVTPVEGSTLGEEYYIGDPQGPTITVVYGDENGQRHARQMWAGQACVFR